MDNAVSDELNIPPSLRKRFYEPVVLLDALRSVYLKDNQISEPDLEGGSGKSPQQTYFCFLNKLSQICDSQPKQPLGKTVSAIVVLDSGTIEYRFASNQRDSLELDTVKEYLTSILDVLGHVKDGEVNDRAVMGPIFSGILQKVLAFNRPRVEDYMEALNDRLGFCINSSSADGTSQGSSVASSLRMLQPHLEAARDAPSLNHDEFARHSEALLQTIHAHYEPTLEDYLRAKTRNHTSLTSDSPWSELRHALGRLLSYYIAIKVLISARKSWPRLFVDFSVTTIPSTAPLSQPPVIRRNANGIISRMTRSKATLDAYQHHAQHLQSHGNLDERIRQRAAPARFRPIVHAEVNLLASVLRDQALAEEEGEDPVRFFNQAEFGAYIGSSKPTCLLCSFYFAAHPSGVRCRESHGNLYYNWRAPDISSSPSAGGNGEAQLQREILERMVKDIRKEADIAIRERSYPRRKHDSWDTPTNPLGSTTVGGSRAAGSVDGASMKAWSDESREATPESGGEVEEGIGLAERMGRVNLDGTPRNSIVVRGSSKGQVAIEPASLRSRNSNASETATRGSPRASRTGHASVGASSTAADSGRLRDPVRPRPARPVIESDDEEDDDGAGVSL